MDWVDVEVDGAKRRTRGRGWRERERKRIVALSVATELVSEYCIRGDDAQQRT